MHPAFAKLDHRPWPVPASRWTMRQTWHDLLFAHWPIAAEAVRHLVPSALNIQELAGSTWLGVVPFRMSGVTKRWLPSLPWLSAFPELNVRLYVERDGKPGVWFLSLDATNPLAIWAARRFYHLPYHRAHIAVESNGNGFRYDSERPGSRIRFRATYGPIGPVFAARPGSIEHFLTERYCLYAQAPCGALYRCEIHHLPWPLQPAQATIDAEQLLASHGLNVNGPAPVLHFAQRLDVVVWPMELVM